MKCTKCSGEFKSHWLTDGMCNGCRNPSLIVAAVVQTIEPSPFVTRWKREGGVVDVQVDGINTRDYPDFVDAFVCYAVWATSLDVLSEAELDELNEDGEFIHEQVFKHLF